jgi:diadenosine tetraphosphatase ApaH/serine/threonine PP2A family protein phosphatase
VFDILWSDPQAGDGCIPNSLRGAGTYFGPDVTEKFLQKYKLLYLVRSHECKPDGYELTHSTKVRQQLLQLQRQFIASSPILFLFLSNFDSSFPSLFLSSIFIT